MKKVLSIFSLVTIFAVPLFYNNCASYHSPGSSSFASAYSGCEPILVLAFSPMHEFLTNKCSNCHIAGGAGSGSFADSDIEAAFQPFAAKGINKVVTFAVDSGHQSPFTGPDNQEAVDAAKQTWEAAQPTYNECLLTSSGSGKKEVHYNQPTILTDSKQIVSTLNQVTTMSWDLNTELSSIKLQGAQFKIDIQEFYYESTAISGYYFSNPRLTAGNESAYVNNIGIALNGQVIGPPAGQTWIKVERYIPANEERQLSPSGGTMQVPIDTSSIPTIAIAFGKIGPAGFDFQPPTFYELSTTVFEACNNCHNNTKKSGGVNMTSYNSLIGTVGNSGLPLVLPFDPGGSLVNNRMNDPNQPMPISGVLDESKRLQVQHWILDGAPR